MEIGDLFAALRVVVFASVFFVWVVRYDNIIKEFQEYGLPAWLRDFTGILKLSFAAMLLTSNSTVVLIGAAGLALLMSAAVFTHLRMRNSPVRMVPSVSLVTIALLILVSTIVFQTEPAQLFDQADSGVQIRAANLE